MENIIDVLKKAKYKKIFAGNEFEEMLTMIQSSDKSLSLDWDDGAGEEWARFFNNKDNIVCMINAKIGVAFIRNSYEYDNIKNVIYMLEIVYVDNYSAKNWFVDLEQLSRVIPEIFWHASEGAVNVNSFSLDDFYFATV